ncbi:MAG: ABC transporter permease [Actinomycetota bacterium]|nr:ABC transporter permease [Actinomycetota bacterium]
MLSYIIRRLVYGIVTLFALSLIVFMLIQFSGGSPLDRLKLNPRMQPVIALLTEQWGLDKPWYQQYLIWLRNFVTPIDVPAQEGVTVIFGKLGIRSWVAVAAVVAAAAYSVGVFFVNVKANWWRTFRAFSLIAAWAGAFWIVKSRIIFALNWGISFRGDGPVWDNIFGAAGNTFRLGGTALLLALIIGIPLGIYQAIKQYSFFDQMGTTLSFITFSTPIFIIGVGLQLLLALNLERWTGVKIFYVAGMTSSGYSELGRGFLGLPSLAQWGDILQHLTLPAISIAAISMAGYSRFQRASMLEVMHSDYLRTAKAKGLPRRTIIVKHALRNALIPIVTLVSLDIATIIGGAIITESIFAWPGVGRLYLGAIQSIDYPTIMAVVMAIGAGVVVMNILADVLYGVLDPRVRYD